MAYVIDTEQFNIVIMAEGEGFGQLLSITVDNITAALSYAFDMGTQVWSPSAPTAYPGDSIVLSASIQNTATVQDVIFGRFSSGQVVPAEPQDQSQVMSAGGVFSPSWSFTMPGLDVNISLSAGHEEPD